MHKASFLDDYVDPHPLGAGLYWGIEFREAQGMRWKADLWGWAPGDYDRRQQDDARLIDALAVADRSLILRLKRQARERPGYYGARVSSMDIYRFVLAQAGESLDALETWMSSRRTHQDSRKIYLDCDERARVSRCIARYIVGSNDASRLS